MTDGVLPDMTGIEPRFYSSIGDEAQARVASALPGCRLVWNQKAWRFHVLHSEPGLEFPYDDGAYLHGWGPIATFSPPLDVETIVVEMRRREKEAAKIAKGRGADGIEDYLDAVATAPLDDDDPNSPMVDAKTKALVSDMVDDYESQFPQGVTKVGAFGEFGNSHKLVRSAATLGLDSTSRAHSGKFRPTIILPKRRERPALIVPTDFVEKGLVE